jgi:hypothetical protein
MPLRRNWMVFGCTVGLLSMLLLVSARSAFASASVRFVHAIPDGDSATLTIAVGDAPGRSIGPESFGGVSAPLEVDAGDGKLTLAPAAGENNVLSATDETLDDGASYTVVALPKEEGDGAELQIFKDAKPKKGKALIRVIHAAPELGDPDVRVGDRVVAEKIAYGDGTDYVDVPPGAAGVSVTRAGGKGGALATKPEVPLTAGTATTAVIVGSRGEPTRVLTISESTAAPAGAPATGFGGLASDGGGPPRALVALLFAMVAGSLGAAGWVMAGRR